jgi:CheY-like chemotaxis protein
MPRISGLEAGRRLRSRPELASTMLVALTGYAGPFDREKTAAAGFDHHLTKPIEHDNLLEMLRIATGGVPD